MRKGVSGRIIITRAFQKTLGELAMSRFIAFSGHTLQVTDLADQMWDALIKAYILFVGLPFILNYAGRAIYRNINLKPYFDQWEVCKEYFDTRERQHWSQVQDGDWSGWCDYILKATGYSKPLYDTFNPRESLLNVERYKSARLLEMQDEGQLTDVQLCQLPATVLKDAADARNFFFMQAESVPLVSVFIGMDVLNIFSNIQLMTIYRKAIAKEYSKLHIPAWIDTQSAQVTTTQGWKAKLRFDHIGQFTVKVPKLDLNPYHAVLDTYGLKATIDLSKLPTQLVFTESWSGETHLPPTFDLLFTEYWTHETPLPPVMELVISELWGKPAPVIIQALLEEWTGYTPPLTFELAVMERWSEEAPVMVLAVFERWGGPEPEMTRAVLEQWTA